MSDRQVRVRQIVAFSIFQFGKHSRDKLANRDQTERRQRHDCALLWIQTSAFVVNGTSEKGNFDNTTARRTHQRFFLQDPHERRMVLLRHCQIRNKRKKFGLIFTAIVCYGLRAAQTHLLAAPRPTENESTPHVTADAEREEQHVEEARYQKSIPFPFELVHDTWENGPQDENLLR